MKFNFYTDLLKAEKTDEGLFLTGVASTTGIDKQNESMSKAALESMVSTTGIIPIVTSHNAEAKDTIGEIVSHSIDAEGRYVIKARLEESDPEAMKMWNLINKGHKLGFSVGGRVLSSKPSFNKAVKRVIDKVELDHIMLTRRPVNPETYAVALTKALENMETENIQEDVIEKAGAKHSAETIAALKNIHAAGDDNIKSMVSALMGDSAGLADNAPNEAPEAEAVGTEADAPKTEAAPEANEGPNVDDNDADDKTKDVGASIGVVAGKSLTTEEFDIIKASIVETVKAELAKSMKPEPKVSEPLAKAERVDPANSLSEAIRKSLGG